MNSIPWFALSECSIPSWNPFCSVVDRAATIQRCSELVDGDDRIRVVVVVAVGVEAERGPAGLDRTAERELDSPLLRRLLDHLLRLPRVELVAAPVRVHLAAPVRVRARHDVDLRAAGVVVVRRVVVLAEPDRADLVAARQAAALEAVHEERRPAWSGHLRQHFGQFIRIVRQRVDLFLRQRERRGAL